MPSFSHSLIGLGPFANQGCRIVFNKATVTVFHPKGHTILEGWHELDGPQLWQFLLTGLPHLPAASPPPPPTLLPPPLDQDSGVPSAPKSNNLNIKSNLLKIAKLPDQDSYAGPFNVHNSPCQGINATNKAGEDVSVYYLYKAAQAMAMAAQASNTAFVLQSLNLPSIGTLVGFNHACLGFPVKQTWVEAIKAGNCDNFIGLTYSNAARYCPNLDKTILGHLAQQRQHVRLTKPNAPTPVLSSDLPPTPLSTTEEPSNQVFVKVYPLSKLNTDDTGCFPVRACSGNQYAMIAFHPNGNLILQQAFMSKNNCHRIAAYNAIMSCLASQGLAVDLQILDNETSAA
jgi:hypothetical protein